MKHLQFAKFSLEVVPDSIFLKSDSASLQTELGLEKFSQKTAIFIDRPSPASLSDASSVTEAGISLNVIFAHVPELALYIMSAQKPSINLQALALSLIVGFNKIRLMDPVHQVLKSESERLTDGGVNLQFLSLLLRIFPDALIDVKDDQSDRYINIRNTHAVDDSANWAESIAETYKARHEKLLAVLTDLESSKQRNEILVQQVKEYKREASALKSSRSFRIGRTMLQPMHKARSLLQTLPRSEDSTHDDAQVIRTGRKHNADEVDVLVICHEVSSMTGVHRPIMLYMKEMEQRGANIQLLDLSRWDKSRVAEKKIPAAPITIVNSIAAIQWKSIRSFLAEKPANTWIYLHETAWTIEKFKFTNPEDFAFLEKHAPDLPMLAVSDAQKSLMKNRFGAKRVDVIRNVTPNANMDFDNVRAYEEKETPPSIIMVGTIQARKGAELFSLVADLAAEQKRPWKFRWIGHATSDDLYLSDLVDWAGVRKGEELLEEYRKASLFFLPSRDDPFPLSAIEAMSFGIKLVTYKNVGSAEIIGGLHGCLTFNEYSAVSAFQAIERSLAETADQRQIFDRARPYADPAHFADVLNKTIDFRCNK